MKNYALKFSLFVCYIASFSSMLLFFIIILICNILKNNYYFPLTTLVFVFVTCFIFSTCLLILFFINAKRGNKVLTYASFCGYGVLLVYYLLSLILYVVPSFHFEYSDISASSSDFELIVDVFQNTSQYCFCVSITANCILGFVTSFCYIRHDNSSDLIDFL